MKKTPAQFLKPHLRDYNPEERHLVQKGFSLGIQYTREEMDAFIKEKTANLN